MKRTEWRDSLFQIATHVVWGMVGAVMVMSAYHAAIGPSRGATLAAVDLVALIQEQRERGVREAGRGGTAGDEDIAVAQLAAFGARVESAAREVASTRGLILVQSQTVVAGEVPDVTDDVRRRLESGGRR